MTKRRSRVATALLIGTILAGGNAVPAAAQRHHARDARAPRGVAVPVPTSPAVPTTPAPEPNQPQEIIKEIRVVGNERLEPATVLSYVDLHVGDVYTRDKGDAALKALFATELFADVKIRDENGVIIIDVRENPIVNRVVLEGNKRIKSDKIQKELKLTARDVFTRSKVRADVERILQLYRREGRFAATVDPQMVLLDQNRVDVIYEIHEGDKSKVRRINIIGNNHFSDGQLKAQMATKEASLVHFLSSGTSYDPDRMAYDQQKMRQFYLTQGYADFRVVSAVAELTPDKHNFIITYVIEEGKRYKFGDIKVVSDIRDVKPALLESLIHFHKGDWYNAKTIEDTVDTMTNLLGALGYAFADIEPEFHRDPKTLTMGVTFRINQTPRAYIERININGNVNTQDKVIRREFRVHEGDAFNGFLVKRSRDRIRSLGFFQDKLEVEQKPGSSPDKVILETNVEEKSTGSLQVSAGYSSLEKFIVSLSIEQANFRGKGQTVRASADWSAYSKSVSLGFTEPYLFDKNIALGGDVYRRELNSFDLTNNGDNRHQTYDQTTTGFQIRMGVPITEYWQLAGRYTFNHDDVSLDKATYYSNINGVLQCDPLLAGRYLCDALGKYTTSAVGYSLVYDSLNNRIRPTGGSRFVFSQDFAGLGGDVKYLKTQATADHYKDVGAGFVLNAHLEGGYIFSYGGQRHDASGNPIDDIRLTDRFYLGEPQIRGFDIRGIGPRVVRIPYNSDGTLDTKYADRLQDDALGGHAYYLGHLEMQLPLGGGAREAGFRPSIFVDAGSVFDLKAPQTSDYPPGSPQLTRNVLNASGGLQCITTDGSSTVSNASGGTCAAGSIVYSTSYSPFKEIYYGSTWRPRVSVGFGVSWNSPFGPLRVDIAKALIKQPGDDTKLFSFNVGTQF